MLRATALAMLVLVALVAPAGAEIESHRVRAGLTAYRQLEYERALRLFDEAVRTESLTREEKLAVFQASGVCHVALDRPDAARSDFVRLLSIEPGSELDDRVSPRVRAVFEQARAEVALRGQQTPSAHHLPELGAAIDPPAPREGDGLAVAVRHPGGLAARGQLFHRVRGELSYARIEAPVDALGEMRFAVPGSSVRAPGLEAYVVVLDGAGTAIARAGSLGAPLSLPVRVRPLPLHQRRWFWGVIGGVAGAAVLSAIVVGVTLSAPATITVLPR
jgi:hypothetical protein